MADSEIRKEQLHQLIKEYKKFKGSGKLNLTSEETIRGWLNDFLEIFGWDVRDTSQILQEKILSSNDERERLIEIESTNNRPDYTFKIAKQKLSFLDAKNIGIDLESNTEAAFQIKSYGWSIMAPCAFISNFEQFAIYDCTYVPNKEQSATFGRIFLTIDEYLDNFEVLENHLLRENVYSGKLKELYSDTKVEGVERLTPDYAFANLLSDFRLKLASHIFETNEEVIKENSQIISFAVQVIINRILFIRVCEARKLEEDNLLLRYSKSEKGFWKEFKKSSYFEFHQHYDGPLFDRIDIINQLEIDDSVFDKLLTYLYPPSPYRFDVIPTKLLSDIYEIFLSKKIKIENGEVKDELKSEYSKTKGAVSTPQFIVDDIVRRTITLQSNDIDSISDILKYKILDISCGSGVFVIGVFEYLEELLINNSQKFNSADFEDNFVEVGDDLLLTLKAKKALIDYCIYGVDIDPEAVEVTKMSLALKTIDNSEFPEASGDIGLLGNKILEGIGKNIKCGNSLIDSHIIDVYPELLDEQSELFKTNIFDWKDREGFEEIFNVNDGFDYIVGNPPYVEVKNYNQDLPHMHKYIKSQYESSRNGKVDLAIPFIERGIDLLNKNGRLGFIVQKRFFKTSYGKRIREIISRESLISSIVDFESTNIFKGRITYVSIIVLDKVNRNNFYYRRYDDDIENLPTEIRNSSIPEIDSNTYYKLPSNSVTNAPWSFDDPNLIKLRTKLLKLGKLGDAINVKVGIQALWDRAYHIRPIKVENGVITGTSGIEENFQIEINACRPLICNEHFYPFRNDEADVFVLFPYDVLDGNVEKIQFSDFSERFPRAGNYLNRNKNKIVENVETLPEKRPDQFNDEYWHIFTREQNHKATYPKVMIPMTAKDTYASITFSSNTYCDNANVNFIELDDRSNLNLYSIAAIINSTVFSVMARSIANPQANGYFKFNKQFLEPTPFPVSSFQENEKLKSKLHQIAVQIEHNQNDYFSSSPTQKNTIKKVLRNLWDQLDKIVFQLYNLNDDEIDFLKNRGRNINRVNFLDQ